MRRRSVLVCVIVCEVGVVVCLVQLQALVVIKHPVVL